MCNGDLNVHRTPTMYCDTKGHFYRPVGSSWACVHCGKSVTEDEAKAPNSRYQTPSDT